MYSFSLCARHDSSHHSCFHPSRISATHPRSPQSTLLGIACSLITIPLGQYVPKFEPSGAQQKELTPDSMTQTQSAIEEAAHPARERWVGRAIRLRWRIVAPWVAAILVFGIGWFVFHQRRSLPSPGMSKEPIAQPGLQFGPPVGDEVRILAGSGRSFVDHAGKLWSADIRFTGGTVVKNPVQHIWRTQDPEFYRTSREGLFRYDVPLRRGIYELRLHFAETLYGPESTGTGGEGSRIMTVRANGNPLLTNFDVVADAGSSNTADVKVFSDVSPAADGMLHLEFAGENGKQAMLSAIEILPGERGHIRPVRVLTRQTPYYSNDSNWWSPDNYFEGGQLATYTTSVSGTDDPELYETERWGNFSYAIPVSPGKYSLTLFFATRHGAWDRPSISTSEDRSSAPHVFNVFCNGRVLLQDFNLAREARQFDVVVRKFSALSPNAQGKLLLSFVPVEGYATVTGIEVLPQ